MELMILIYYLHATNLLPMMLELQKLIRNVVVENGIVGQYYFYQTKN